MGTLSCPFGWGVFYSKFVCSVSNDMSVPRCPK